MKKIIAILLIGATLNASATVYFTKTGSIKFKSNTKLEKIEGANKSVACKLDGATGALDFIVLIKSFVFENQLLQEHFNENYMESDKFAKASFKGKITNLAEIDFTKNGTYKATVTGTMTIHGVPQSTTATGTITVKDGKISMNSAFSVACADYKIAIPSAVADKLSKDISVTVACSLDQLK
jgi:hypothetical protein